MNIGWRVFQPIFILAILVSLGSPLALAEEPPPAPITEKPQGVTLAQAMMDDALLAVKPTANPGTNDSQGLTLEQAIQEALANNLELQAKRQELEIAKAQLLKAVWPNPELEGGLTTDALTGNEGEKNVEVGFSQAIPWSGRLRYQKQAATRLIERTGWDIHDRERLLTLDVTKAFTQVVALQEQLKVLELLIQINRQLVETAEARFAKGEVSQIEVQVGKVEFQQDRVEQKRLQAELKTATSSLNLLLGRPKKTTRSVIMGQLTYQPVVLDAQRLTRWALINRPDVMMLDADIRQAEALIKLAKASRFEDLKASTFFQRSQGRLQVNEEQVKDNKNLLGFKVSIPLPLFDRKKGDIKEALARREVARITKELIILRVEREIEQLIAQLTSLQDIVGSYSQDILTTLDQSIETIQNAYAQGQVSFFEVIQTEERLINFKRSYVESLTNYINTRAELTTALGGTWPEITNRNTIEPTQGPEEEGVPMKEGKNP